VPEHRMAIMADASTKPCHFKAAGRAQTSIMPTTSTFLGDLASQVQTDYDTGVLTSAAQQRRELELQEEQEGEGRAGGAACTSVLSCSRSIAAPRGQVDITGIAGVTCAHAQPARGAFLNMPTPEQHEFHRKNISHVITERPDTSDVYIDVGCRMWRSQMEQLAQLAASGVLPQSTLEKASWRRGVGGCCCGWVGGWAGVGY
jgi:hypothetical protein